MADYEMITKDIQQLARRNRIKGLSYALFNGEEILVSGEMGIAEKLKEEDRVIDNDTRFVLGSVVKLITAFSIMQLVDKDEISLDDNIKKYIPEFKINNRYEDSEITIRDILNERSGLPSDNIDLFLKSEGKDYHGVLEYLKEQYLIAPPKMMSAKSNIGFSLLGIIIEKICGKSYLEYIKENIFQPLDIDFKVAASQKDFDSMSNDITLSFGVFNKKDEEMSVMTPSIANIYIKKSDYIKLIQLLLNNGMYQNKMILSEKSVLEMLLEPEYEDEVKGVFKTNLGLGFSRKYTNSIGKTIVCENNMTYQKSYIMIAKNEKLVSIAFTNTETEKNISEKICSILLESELGVSYRLEKRKKQTSYLKCKIEDYAGMYPTAYGQISVYLGDFLTLKYNEDMYKMQLREDGFFDLLPVKPKLLFGEKKEMSVLIQNGLLTLKVKEEDGATTTNTLGCLIKPTLIDEEWKKALGEYKIVKAPNDELLYENLELTLINGFVSAIFSKGNRKVCLSIGIVNSNEGIVLGYGDESNSTIFLSLSTIKYCGMTFVKIKESPLNKVKEKKEKSEKMLKKEHKKKIDKMFDIQD